MRMDEKDKKLLKVGVVMLIVAVGLSVAVYVAEFSGWISLTGITVDQQNGCATDNIKLDDRGTYYSQSFIPTMNTINNVKIQMIRVHENASAAMIRVAIYETRPDILTESGRLVYDDITMASVGDEQEWQTFDMGNVVVTPGQEYWITIQLTKDAQYPVRFYCCHSDTYKRGVLERKETGKDWNDLISGSLRGKSDMTFQVWGFNEIFHEP